MGRVAERRGQDALPTAAAGGSAAVAGGLQRIPDSLPGAVVHRTAAYAEFYRAMRIAYAPVNPLPIDPRSPASYVLDGRDCAHAAALDAVPLPLAALYRQARAAQSARTAVACFRRWLAAEGWHEAEVDHGMCIRHATRGGLVVLATALGARGLRIGASLPSEVASWLRRTGSGAPAGVMRTVVREGRPFTLRALPAVDGDGWLLYISERGPDMAVPASGASPEPPALSPREREVLEWVAAGKTDAQAAAILGISVRTVQKHLENVYVKLGVEGRTAAVMRSRTGTVRR